MFVESDGTGRCSRVARFAFGGARNLKAPVTDDRSVAEIAASTSNAVPIRRSPAAGFRLALVRAVWLAFALVLTIGGAAEAQQLPGPAELRP